MRLVLDTDVVLSGLQSPSGASRLLLQGVFARAFTPLVTVATVLEYEDVLLRPQALAATGLTREETIAFLDGIIAHAEPVLVRQRHRPSIRDPADEIFVEALLNGGGDFIVTFNRRDYLAADERIASRGQLAVPVLTPGETLRRLTWRPAATTRSGFPPP
jgi:predicted nucleic acid-binding protein